MKEEQIVLAGCIVIVLLLVLSKKAYNRCQQGRQRCLCSGGTCRCSDRCRCGCRREGMAGRAVMNRPGLRRIWGLNSSNQYPHGNFVTQTRW
jgi:hypothetical protein